jgi:hypothetical protein
MSVPEIVVEYVNNKGTVSASQMSEDLQISIGSARNYLSRLKRESKVIKTGTGAYRVSSSDNRLEVPMNVELIRGLINKRYPTGDFVIWSLGMLANYAHYEVGKDLIVVEAGKAIAYRIRDILLSAGYNALLNPHRKAYMEYTYYDYVLIEERTERFGVMGDLPEPERLIVDVYFAMTRKMLNFSAYELGVILGNALRAGDIDLRRLLTYSSRRGIGTEMTIILYEAMKRKEMSTEVFFKKQSGSVVKEIIQGATGDE